MNEERNRRKVRQGVVVSATNDKTIVVQIQERKPHRVYGKMITTTKKFHAHDEGNEAGVGDTVRIQVNENYAYDVTILSIEKTGEDPDIPISTF